MVVRKILETTLVAGSTSVTFTDTDIPNSLLRVYATKASLFPISQTLSGNTLTVNYKAQTTNVGVALEIVKQSLDIVDNVVTEDATKALSANQGVVLKDLIDGLSIPDNITDLDDVSVSSIQNGQVLAWNELTEKFVNVNQSGGSTQDYTETEVLIGKWIDNKNLYKKTIKVTNVSMAQLSVYDLATLTNIDTIFLDSAFAIEGSIVYMIPEFGMRIRFDISTQKIQAVTPSGSVWSNATFVVNILYTKTVE